MSENLNLTLPAGTQVVVAAAVRGSTGAMVCQRGAVGVVVDAPVDGSRPYRVRLANGVEVELRREELRVRKHLQRAGLEEQEAAQGDSELYECVIYRCVIGSRAYGLHETGSDTDRRGIYLPPAERHWSLSGVPEQLENDDTQECYWEIRKFLTLALKAKPNILECLYTPLVEQASPLAQELLAMRSIFLSRLIYQTYNGYVMSQFKKMEQDLRNRGELRWKHAMHLIRLLLSGVTTLKEGFVPIRVEEHREGLLAIRRGEVPWEEVNAWRLRLHAEFDAAFAATHLPEHPDYERTNAFLIRARRSAL
jgi:hypothetical protein